jgi:hypothetical protein
VSEDPREDDAMENQIGTGQKKWGENPHVDVFGLMLERGESIMWTTKHRDAQGITDLPQHRLVGERSEKGCGLGESNLYKT